MLPGTCFFFVITEKFLDKMYNLCIIILKVCTVIVQVKHKRRTAMSNYELQIRATEQYYDEAIRAAEQENIEILSSVVPGSRLHQVIHNPVDSGIDEG